MCFRSIFTFEPALGGLLIYCPWYDWAISWPDSGFLFLHSLVPLKSLSIGIYASAILIYPRKFLQEICFGQIALVRHRSQDGQGPEMTFLMTRSYVFLFFQRSLTFYAYKSIPNLSIATHGSEGGIFRTPLASSLMGCPCSFTDR